MSEDSNTAGSNVPLTITDADINDIQTAPVSVATSANVPPGYLLNDTGLYQQSQNGGDNQRISDALRVIAETRDDTSNAWGKLIEWWDADGKRHSLIVPMAALVGSGHDFLASLAQGGLRMTATDSAQRKLLAYLNEATPRKRILTEPHRVCRRLFGVSQAARGVAS